MINDMLTTIKITPKKLQRMIKSAVREEFQELMKDPDAGLKLRKSTIDRLRRSERQARAGKVHTLEEVVRDLGIAV